MRSETQVGKQNFVLASSLTRRSVFVISGESAQKSSFYLGSQVPAVPTAPTKEEQKGRDSGRIRQEETLYGTEVRGGGVQAKS